MLFGNTNFQSSIYESKQKILKLPPNFFEKYLDLELNLKKKFSVQTLEEMVNMLSIAIEYFENTGDVKFKNYQTHLELLLQNPGIMKKLGQEHFKNLKTQNLNNSGNKKKFNKLKAEDKIKIQYRKANEGLNEEDDSIVKEIIMKSNFDSEMNIIDEDLAQQESDFNLRFKEKLSNKLRNTVIRNPIDTQRELVNLRKSLGGENIKQTNNADNIESNIRITIRHDFIMKHQKENNENILVKGVKDIIDSFLSDFNDYFHSNIFNDYTEHIEELIDSKYKKYLEITHNYQSNIKEMELLLTNAESEDDPNTFAIKEMISNLEEEQRKEISKNEEEHQKLIKESYDKFNLIGFQKNEDTILIEKNFKSEILKLIDNVLKSN